MRREGQALRRTVDKMLQEVNGCGPRSLWIRSGIGLRGREIDSRNEVPVSICCLDQRTDPIDPPGGERASLLVRMNRYGLLRRWRWRGLVELAGHAGVEFALPPSLQISIT